MAELSLCKKLAQGIGAGDSPVMPKIFEILVNDDEANVLLSAFPPVTIEELAEKTGFSQEKIAAMMDSLFNRGLIFKARKGDAMRYYRVKSVPQMHDSTTLTPGVTREVLNLWKEYMEKEWPAYGAKIMEILPGSIMRVIPVNEGIVPESKILAYDDVIRIIEEAKTLFSNKVLLPSD